jgi:hypothetical protein
MFQIAKTPNVFDGIEQPAPEQGRRWYRRIKGEPASYGLFLACLLLILFFGGGWSVLVVVAGVLTALANPENATGILVQACEKAAVILFLSTVAFCAGLVFLDMARSLHRLSQRR